MILQRYSKKITKSSEGDRFTFRFVPNYQFHQDFPKIMRSWKSWYIQLVGIETNELDLTGKALYEPLSKFVYETQKEHASIMLPALTEEKNSSAICIKNIQIFGCFQQHNIYNWDETALTNVHNPRSIVGHRGLRPIRRVTSRERDVLVTSCYFINALGHHIPPFLMFPIYIQEIEWLLGHLQVL